MSKNQSEISLFSPDWKKNRFPFSILLEPENIRLKLSQQVTYPAKITSAQLDLIKYLS